MPAPSGREETWPHHTTASLDEPAAPGTHCHHLFPTSRNVSSRPPSRVPRGSQVEDMEGRIVPLVLSESEFRNTMSLLEDAEEAGADGE
eukprot:363308-Chlamydomonas_euryale.AAC.6